MNVLIDIVRHKRAEVALRKKRLAQKDLARKLNTETRDFIKALRLPGLSIIAEIKYRSPSAGILLDERDPAVRASMYDRCGARALSVLTDEEFFGGSNEHLQIARAKTRLPVLRKDFIIDEYQIYESRYIGADAVLLIVRLLDQPTLSRFLDIAHALHMTCLVEVHSEDDLAIVCQTKARCIGINNRDLDSLDTDIQTSLLMKPLIPADRIAVSESGVSTREDIVCLEGAGFDAVLIGHVLATSTCVEATMLSLQGRSNEKTR
jgi:indole-3-glycerol phosphate synthase